jgi:folate-binding protein YgfZ
MTAERWEAIRREGGAVDLSSRAKWLLEGEDRVRYLNGQVTQDMRKATAMKAVYGCVTDLKGRICGDIFVTVTPDGNGLLVDAEACLRESLGARLERYVVADDVEITDVTDEWSLTHFFFGEARNGVEGGSESERVGVPGRDIWRSPGVKADGGAGLLTDEEVEVLRVLNGVARYPFELNSEAFPPEAALELRAMDYSKGCYIGQEVLSRIRTSRKMPRELVAWKLQGARGVAAGEVLVLPGSDGRVLGRVTSAVIDPATGFPGGLAYVKLGTVPDDSQLLVGNDLATIQRLIPGPFL